MLRLFTLIFLLTTFIVHGQIDETETEDKENIVTVVTVSSSETKSEAIKFALRDALEQSYGTFISSNTKILNDEIYKDEIVSISSGNIINYEILSELQLPNGFFSVTISSQVSLKSFATYMQKKGHKVSFSGSKFSMNIKLLKLNEESEKKAINNMLIILKDLIKSCIDFKISGLPTAPALIPLGNSNTMKNSKEEELYKVLMEVKWELNKNYKSFVDFLKESLRSISMKNSEIEEYLRLNKSTHEFFFYDQKNIVYPNDNIPDTFKATKKYTINSYIGGSSRRVRNDERLDYQYSSARKSLFSKWWKENKILMDSKYPPGKGKKFAKRYSVISIKNPNGRKSSMYRRNLYDSIIGSFEKFIEREVYSKEDLAIEKMITHNTILNMNFTESETKAIFDPDFLKKLDPEEMSGKIAKASTIERLKKLGLTEERIIAMYKKKEERRKNEPLDNLRVNDSTLVFRLISSYDKYQEKTRKFLQGAGELRVDQILASKGEGNINNAIRYNSTNYNTRRSITISKIGEHTYLAADGTYKINQFDSGRLRGHEKLYFRNEETLKLISKFLFSNLDYLYDFNIKYGKNNFNPITLIPRLLKNGGSDYRGGWSQRIERGSSPSYYSPYNSVQFFPSSLGLPGTWFISDGMFMNNLDRDRSFSEVHFISPRLYTAFRKFQTHTIAFYLTLKDLEEIDDFELVNNN